VWGGARASGGGVLLRIEDHDRQRCRPEFDAALVEDLDWLGFVPDTGPVRQTDPDASAAYADALERLRSDGLAYGCSCTRSTFSEWAHTHGRAWRGPGCPGDCQATSMPETTIRVALGGGTETWEDALLGRQVGEVGTGGDLVIRDRHGYWAYGFAVVVDDLRHGIDLVVRGRDLLDATAGQIRLSRALGRSDPLRFAHHALVRRPDGRKLSKADGATGIRDLRSAGWTPEAVIGATAASIGLVDAPLPMRAAEAAALVAARWSA
jgi:glutamyl/glutaminyl-tRNA synthetase